MKKTTLLEFKELLSKEVSEQKKSIYPENVECAAFTKNGADKRSRVRTDIFLSSLPEPELNELREIIAMGSYFNADKKIRIKRLASFPFNDPEKRRRILDVKHLSAKQCISKIRERAAAEVLKDIESYCDIEPQST